MKTAAALARDRERALRLADRERVREMRDSVARLKRDIAKDKITHRKERRERLGKARRQLRTLPSVERAHRRRMLQEVIAYRADFQAWWAAVLQQRAERRAELRQLTDNAKRYRRGAKERLRLAKEAIERETERYLDEAQDAHRSRHERLVEALVLAQRELDRERADQRQFSGTKRQLRKRAPKVTRKEKRQEFTGGVEANLLTAEEHIVWRKAKRQILSNAKARGITAPDAIAELVREYAELNEEQVTDWMQSDADSWLDAELRKQGYQ